MLIENLKGNFKFIKGIGPFSFGSEASSGFEIVHVRFNPLPSLDSGFELMERHLKAVGRPMNALCEIELRIQKPLTTEGFGEFNRGYQQRLERWGLNVDGTNPVSRTNVANQVDVVPAPSVH